jgi:glutathione S-transferase
MTDYTLFGSLHSGHSYKARLALLMLGIEHDYRAIDIAVPRAARDPDWRRHSRFGEVPVLIANGVPIVQSDAILLHLCRTHGALGWPEQADGVTSWLFWEANRIGFSLPNYRFHALFGDGPGDAVMAWLHGRMLADLAALEEAVTASPFLLGDALTAADIACGAYLLYRDLPGLDLEVYPAISAWLARIEARPGWRAPQDVMG